MFGTVTRSLMRPKVLMAVGQLERQLLSQRRWKSNRPMNTVILFVPQQEAWVVERMGKYHRSLEPGLNILLPIIDKVTYVQSLKEIAIEIPKQSAITLDNVTLSLDGVLYLKVMDPLKSIISSILRCEGKPKIDTRASYGVEDPQFAISQLAQTTMRSELGKITLDRVFRERESLNEGIVEVINKASAAWGITCLRYEIRDIKLPNRVQEAMQMQVEAERKKRATVLESEGMREADINIAEGKKRAKILSSEAEKTEQINMADGEAAAILAKATARAKSVQILAHSLSQQNGVNAASLNVAEIYVKAFGNLAKTGNTVILPSNVGDISGMVTQAMTIYQTLAKNNPTIDQGQVGDDERAELFSDEEELSQRRAPFLNFEDEMQAASDKPPEKS